MCLVTKTIFISFASRSGDSNTHYTHEVKAGPDGRVSVTVFDIVEETRERGALRADNRDIRIFHGSASERAHSFWDLFSNPHAEYKMYFEINLGDTDGWARLDAPNCNSYNISLDQPPMSVVLDRLPPGTRVRAVVIKEDGLDVIESVKVSLTCTTHEG